MKQLKLEIAGLIVQYGIIDINQWTNEKYKLELQKHYSKNYTEKEISEALSEIYYLDEIIEQKIEEGGF